MRSGCWYRVCAESLLTHTAPLAFMNDVTPCPAYAVYVCDMSQPNPHLRRQLEIRHCRCSSFFVTVFDRVICPVHRQDRHLRRILTQWFILGVMQRRVLGTVIGRPSSGGYFATHASRNTRPKVRSHDRGPCSTRLSSTRRNAKCVTSLSHQHRLLRATRSPN